MGCRHHDCWWWMVDLQLPFLHCSRSILDESRVCFSSSYIHIENRTNENTTGSSHSTPPLSQARHNSTQHAPTSRSPAAEPSLPPQQSPSQVSTTHKTQASESASTAQQVNQTTTAAHILSLVLPSSPAPLVVTPRPPPPELEPPWLPPLGEAHLPLLLLMEEEAALHSTVNVVVKAGLDLPLVLQANASPMDSGTLSACHRLWLGGSGSGASVM